MEWKRGTPATVVMGKIAFESSIRSIEEACMTWWKQNGTLMALVLGSLLFATPMLVADATTTTTNFTVKGNTAVAAFEGADPLDPCIVDTVTIVSSESMQKVSPGGKTSTTGTMLFVAQEDVCLDIFLLEGEGDTTQQTLRFKDLTSATLTATVPVFDEVSKTVINFSVNLIWTATGPAVTETLNQKFRDRDLGLMILIKVRGSHAPAVATGTVMALGQNFTPEPSDSAELQSQNDGLLTLQMTK